MYCTYCGCKLEDGYRFCPACGQAVSGAYSNQTQTVNTQATYVDDTSSVLGTLVAVTLIDGVIRNLYYRNGLYYYDSLCHRPYPMDMIRGPLGHHPHVTIGFPGFFGGLFGGHGRGPEPGHGGMRDDHGPAGASGRGPAPGGAGGSKPAGGGIGIHSSFGSRPGAGGNPRPTGGIGGSRPSGGSFGGHGPSGGIGGSRPSGGSFGGHSSFGGGGHSSFGGGGHSGGGFGGGGHSGGGGFHGGHH